MIELDIEELFAGSMEFQKLVVHEAYGAGSLLLLEDPEILTFTGGGIADRLVYRVGSCVELLIDDYLLTPGMDDTKPIIRYPVSAGTAVEIPIGAKPTWPGDTLHLLDFDEDAGRDLNTGINRGLVLVGITSRRSIILGTMADSVAGFSGLGLIEFLVSGQYTDRMA
jgi:hypothetical protein